MMERQDWSRQLEMEGLLNLIMKSHGFDILDNGMGEKIYMIVIRFAISLYKPGFCSALEISNMSKSINV